MYACNLFNGSNGEVVEEIPRLMSDTFFTFVIAFAGQHMCNKVTASLLVTDVADTCHQFVAHDARITRHIWFQRRLNKSNMVNNKNNNKQRSFNGSLSRITWMSWYQKEHSPTHVGVPMGSSGFYGAREDNRGRCTNNLAGWHPIRVIGAPIISTDLYTRCPFCCSPSNLS